MHKKRSSLFILRMLIFVQFFFNTTLVFSSDILTDSIQNILNEFPSAINLSTRSLKSNVINKPGFYFISRTMPGAIKIRSSDVTLELAGNLVQGGIDIGINLQNVTVKNGIIDNQTTQLAAAIKANKGTRKITLTDLRISNALRGIQFDEVSDGCIRNCEMTQNVTGLELNQSHNIFIESCIASRSTNAGFCLLSSTTNCLRDCKALSTGHANTETADATIVGFVSTNGNGNIFERCIANSTQALSTTDFNSLVAGFALRGSESCSKIIDSESANATSSVEGVTIPYGILLESTINMPITLTGTPPIPGPEDTVNSIDWSPDGRLLAVGIGSGDTQKIRIYEFDRINNILTQVATPNIISGDAVLSVDWSPDGRLLAVGISSGDTQKIRIYEFDNVSNTLNQVATPNVIPGDAVFSVDWSPDGRLLAVGIGSSDTQRVRVYEFDRINNILTQVATPNIIPGDIAFSVAWSPDEKFLAVGISSGDAQRVRVYEFNRANNTLTQVATPNVIPGDIAFSVNWSPNGLFLATGMGSGDAQRVRVYEFDRANSTLIQVATPNVIPAGGVFSVDWSPDEKFLAVGISSGDVQRVRIYEFDRANNTLTQVATPDFIPGGGVFSVNWSPDGGFIAAGMNSADTDRIKLYNALSFPSKNVITNNTVYCNSGNSCPGGIGISGSSIANLIIGNTAYSNPIPQTNIEGGGPIVPTNYAFVTNVFNQLFGNIPSALQNISVGGCEPICMPEQLSLLIKQAIPKACTLLDELAEIASLVPNLAGCVATPVTTSPISSEGFYCLDADIAGGLSITASNVVLDMNGRKVSGGITFSNQDRIRLFDGVVEGTASTNGILAQNCTNVTLQNLTVKNSLIGVNFDEVTGALVEQCTFTQNTTGFELDRSHDVVIDKSIASCNLNAGFCLLSSTTNCLRDCKALSTGEGNLQTSNQTIFGFVATDGNGNIFERCIANSTQGLTVTDSDSLVAGFALRGSESCTKIIDSESANATTSVEGVTIPYGILLDATVNNPITLTAVPVPFVADTMVFVNSVAWSPDGKLLASGIDNTDAVRIRVYQFDRSTNTLTQIATPDIIPGDSVFSVNWSPDGLFLAAGIASTDTQRIRVYQFDRTNNTLLQVALPDVVPGDSVLSVNWSPDGTLLAAGILSTDTERIRVYQFDRINNTLTQVATPDVTPGAFVNSVDWSPDGIYLASGMHLGDASRIRIYEFNKGTNALTQVATPDITPGNSVNSVDWSSSGKFLAAGTAATQRILVYQFDRTDDTLMQKATPDVVPGGVARSVAWSSDEKFIASGMVSIDTQRIRIYQFDLSNNRVNQVAIPNSIPGDTVNEVAWSPDGQFLASAIEFNDNEKIRLYDTLTFPSKNVIKNNTVYCNSGNSCPGGIGISGSSISNYIIGNTAYSNPLLSQEAPVSTNYAFVTNVFNQLFGQGPSAMQNISLGGCEPICAPVDVALLLKQACVRVDDLGACGPTTLTSADIVSGTISITESGNYCIGEDVTTDITITATCASLDLNGKCVTGLIDIATSEDVIMKNGAVTPAAPPDSSTPAAAITLASTTNRAIVDSVVVICADDAEFAGTPGRPGIQVAGNNCQVLNCTVSAGSATAEFTAAAPTGGDGIQLIADATHSLIQHCIIIKTGNGGNSGSDPAGAAGHGIDVSADARFAEIVGCTIMSTGNGGTSFSGSTGGAGGHGINIASGAVDIAARECTIRNTGIGGSGTTAGVPGKAVNDAVTTTADFSMIFSNFAHNIANNTKFDIQSGTGPEDGILSPNPPDATVLNPFANVFTTP